MTDWHHVGNAAICLLGGFAFGYLVAWLVEMRK